MCFSSLVVVGRLRLCFAWPSNSTAGTTSLRARSGIRGTIAPMTARGELLEGEAVGVGEHLRQGCLVGPVGGDRHGRAAGRAVAHAVARGEHVADEQRLAPVEAEDVGARVGGCGSRSPARPSSRRSWGRLQNQEPEASHELQVDGPAALGTRAVGARRTEAAGLWRSGAVGIAGDGPRHGDVARVAMPMRDRSRPGRGPRRRRSACARSRACRASGSA